MPGATAGSHASDSSTARRLRDCRGGRRPTKQKQEPNATASAERDAGAEGEAQAAEPEEEAGADSDQQKQKQNHQQKQKQEQDSAGAGDAGAGAGVAVEGGLPRHRCKITAVLCSEFWGPSVVNGGLSAGADGWVFGAANLTMQICKSLQKRIAGPWPLGVLMQPIGKTDGMRRQVWTGMQGGYAAM